MDEQIPEVRQQMVTLPYFHYDVPVVYLRDGTPYIPVVALCRMLGLRPATHLPRWRRQLLWKCARKLPMCTPHRGTRVVWCLHFGALPLWYASFDWKCVLPERREQLRQASREFVNVPDRLYQTMLAQYERLRRFLFWFLTTYVDAHTFLRELARQWYPMLKQQDSRWLQELLAQGQEIINDALALARHMLHEQAKIPVIDVWRVNHYGDVMVTFSLPLIPVVSDEDEEALREEIEALREWFQDIAGFLREKET